MLSSKVGILTNRCIVAGYVPHVLNPSYLEAEAGSEFETSLDGLLISRAMERDCVSNNKQTNK